MQGVLYDFRCNDCEAVFEQRRMMSDTDLPPCPRCTGSNVTKLISAPSSVLDWRDSDSVHESQRFRSAVRNRQIQAMRR